MRIAIAGSSGLIGTALVEALERRGDEVVRLVRPATDATGVSWDPKTGSIDAAALEGVDVVANFAGRSIGERRWSDREKQLLWQSRVDSTRLLADAVAGLTTKPSLMLNASAVGYYGDAGDRILTEQSPPGTDFLAELCNAWEDATAPAAEAGIGVALLRSGIVLSDEGGAVGRLLAPLGPKWLSPYRWGLGGRVGKGDQWWSWIALRDEVRAILHIIDHGITGPMNMTSPNPVTHREFIAALGNALHRPTVIPIPKWVVSLVLGGELADALVHQGQRAIPTVLTATGFEWEFTSVEEGLREALAS